MKQRLLQVIISVLLIITLTMANFLMLCVNVVSYATDATNENKATNHKNVEFMACFKDAQDNKGTSIEATTNSEDVKVYIQLSVRREGYFNGTISLSESNFEFVTENTNDMIKEITENTITLNQINAGETKEIEVGIKILKEDEFDLNLLNKQSSISFNGTYRDSTEKNIKISAIREVSLNLTSPYVDNTENVLEQEIITNKVLNYRGVDKRILQVKIKSGLNGNMFPIKTSAFNIQTPKIEDKYPETVLVSSNNKLNTNGKQILAEDFSYDSASGILNIEINNNATENKVLWLKSGQDEFIVTYIFDESSDINKQKLVISSEIELYDNKTLIKNSNQIELNSEGKDSVVTLSMEQKENSIYKGKLYYGIDREVSHITTLNVNLDNLINSLNIIEDKETIPETDITSVYKETRINREQLSSVLGNNGILNIINKDTNEIIETINNNMQESENEEIIITYPENVEAIKINVISPEQIGKIEILSTKILKNISKEAIKDTSSIEYKVSGEYVSNTENINVKETNSIVELKEIETSVKLELNKADISTMTTNNVEIRAVLESKNENNTLFVNPTIQIQLPEKIEKVQINSINLLYGNELQIKNITNEDNIINIELEGEQTQYTEEAIEGPVIIINADLETSKKEHNSSEQIKLIYSNDTTIGNHSEGMIEKDINIVSYVGMVTTMQVPEYGIDVINNEGTKLAELEIAGEAKTAQVSGEIINNVGTKVNNVKILGTVPTEGAIEGVNNVRISINDLQISGIDGSKVKVYYSSNSEATSELDNAENGWQEDSTNVKKYLIVVDELDTYEQIVFSYGFNIPENLEYNAIAELGYDIYYTNIETKVDSNIELDNIRLETEKDPVTETVLKDYTGIEEDSNVQTGIESEKTSDEVTNTIENSDLQVEFYSTEDNNGVLQNGYAIRYVIALKNNSDKDKKNLKVEINESDILDIEEIFYVTEESEEFNTVSGQNYIYVEKLRAGEEIEIGVVLKAKVITDSTTKSTMIYAKVTDEKSVYNSNAEEITVIPVNLETEISSENSDTYVKEGDILEYIVTLNNNGTSTLKNIDIENELSNLTTFLKISKNGEVLTEEDYTEKSEQNGQTRVEVNNELEAGEQAQYVIRVAVNKIQGNATSREIINYIKVSSEEVEIKSQEIKHILSPLSTEEYIEEEKNDDNKNISDEEDNSNENTLNTDKDSNGNNMSSSNTKSISGTVWVDSDENGAKDYSEEPLQNILVRLLNTKTNTVMAETKTNSNGFYSFDFIEQGNYIVVFGYDTSKYVITTYEKEGVDSKNSSKAIRQRMTIDGNELTVGATEIIKIGSENIPNVNMGLQNAKNIDFTLDKYVSKIITQNSKGTITQEYNNTTLAKVEIDAKQVSGTTAIIEYTIKITNNGDVDGYVKKVVDYISKDYKFSSELNSDWYQSGDNLYNTSLANEVIKPGETKELKLVVTKQMTENNTGLINNTAEITELYNNYGLTDSSENKGSSDLILSIKTGQVATTIGIILIIVIIISGVTYIVSKRVLRRSI